jgi:hypothetical protein
MYKSINTFVKPEYSMDAIYERKKYENEHYPARTYIDITNKNGDRIGYIRRCIIDNHLYWNGYVYVNTDLENYDDFNDIFRKLDWEYKKNAIPEITFYNKKAIGWDHAHSWDFELQNYTTLDIIVYEVMFMHDLCKSYNLV